MSHNLTVRQDFAAHPGEKWIFMGNIKKKEVSTVGLRPEVFHIWNKLLLYILILYVPPTMLLHSHCNVERADIIYYVITYVC